MDHDIAPQQPVEQVPEGTHRVNAFTDPAGNYPDADRGEAGTEPQAEEEDDAGAPPDAPGHDHFGQDGERGTLTAGESQRLLGDAAEQALPAMEQNNASAAQKLQGIVEQTVADSEFQPRDRLEQHLRDRIREAGLVVSEDGFQQTLAAVHRALDA